MVRAALAAVLAAALALGLAGCGRVGYDPQDTTGDADGGVVPTSLIAVSVGKGPDVPIAGAYVAVDRGGGSYEVFHTDGTGLAKFSVSGPTTFHVVYDGTSSRVLYSLYEIPGGSSIRLGQPDVPSTFTGKTAVNLPPLSGAATYLMFAPRRCGLPGNGTTTTLYYNFYAPCAGTSIHAYAMGRGSNNLGLGWLDLGTITLIDATAVTYTTSWNPVTQAGLSVTGLPAGSTQGSFHLVKGAGLDSIEIDATPTLLVSSGGVSTTRNIIPVADTVYVEAYPSTTSTAMPSSVMGLKQNVGAGDTVLDGTPMLPFPTGITAETGPFGISFTTDSVGNADAVSMSGGIAGSFILSWVAYGPPTLRHIALPVLPSDAPSLDPGNTAVWINVNAALFDVFGVTGVTVLGDIDRQRGAWFMGALPANGVARSQIDLQLL